MDNEVMDGNENRAVSIGNNLQISMKQVQSIYNEITGKTESISRPFKNGHIISLDDIRQLNTKVCQLYEQYNVVAKNCYVVIYHVDDCTEKFSSFERFLLYDQSNLSPCENIRIVYNFLIVLPGTNKPQPYEITIDLHSGAGLREKAENEHGMSKNILRLVSSRAGQVEIEFVDYTVARSFMIAIEKWYEATSGEKKSSIIDYLQKKEFNFASLFRLLTSIVVTLAFLYYADASSIGTDFDDLFKTGLIAFSSIYISGYTALKVGQLLEDKIETNQVVSGLKLNRGDDIAIQKFRKSAFKNHLFIIFSIIQVLVLNLFSTYLATVAGIQ